MSSQSFQADVDVDGRRVLVAWEAEDRGDEVAAGAFAATVLELHASGAEVVVIGDPVPPSVADLLGRHEVTQVAVLDEQVVEAAEIVVCVGEAPRASRLAAAAGTWCVLRRAAGPTSVGRAPQQTAAGPDDARRAAGHVTLIGGGPGAPGLLTRAGEDALREADVVIFDRLAPVSVVRSLAPAAELIDVAKVPRGPGASQQRINDLLVEHGRAGRRVARLKGGDPYVFGRGGEEAIACAEAGVPVSVVPGVSSALSVPALAGIPLTHRGVTQGFSVISGHLPPDHPSCAVDVEALARTGTTVVLLMAVATLPAYCDALIAAGLDPQTPAATIADGSLSGERVVRAPLTELAAAVDDAGIGAPAVTVIGAVVGLDLPSGTA